MAQQISKFDINPSTGKQYGVNPSSGVQDDNYWAQQVDPVVNKDYIAQQHVQQQADQAKSDYKTGIDTAVSGLQTQGTNLDTQYGDLLSKVLGQGTVAMNTATTGENNYLASRGLQSNNGRGLNDLSSAQLAVSQSNQAAASNLSYTEAGLKNTLAQNIAGIQAGGAGTMAQLPLNYGSLALASAANTANISLAGSQGAQAGAAARYIPIPGIGLWDTQTNQFTGGVTNSNMTTGGYSILNVK